MQLKLSQKINKISSEIKFRPKLASWENTLSTAQMFEDQFPDWQIDKGVRSNILLFSKADKEVLKVGFDSFAYVAENVDSASKFRKFLKTISDKFADNGIEIFKEIEFKNLAFFESDLNYAELSDILFEKFYGSQDDVRNISVDSVKDTAFTLDAEKNGFLNHCSFGPVQKTQLLEMLKSPFEFDESQIDEEKTYLCLDVKVSHSEPRLDDLKGATKLIDELEAENKRIFNAYLDLIRKVEK